MTAALNLLAVAGSSLAAAAPALAQTKMSQKVAQYQDHPKDKHHCSICAHFKPPNSCNIVAGVVSPNGWCRLYSPKIAE
ncbi:MAG: high potential iron sulfur protein [Alphaproteobacteria bacterium]|nr:high potential iron sulfur protein [Alphaproteobacteria bacterium]MDE2494314.1 high potential iron sulfur protein [Alphaproteobacteria bacterium]